MEPLALNIGMCVTLIDQFFGLIVVLEWPFFVPFRAVGKWVRFFLFFYYYYIERLNK